MKYSDIEVSPQQDVDEALIEAGLKLVPVIGSTLYAAIAKLGQVYRLTPTQMKVLLNLSAREQMTVGEIATGLGISMPAASELVDRLVDAGRLARSSDPADRRRVLVTATPDSRQIAMDLRNLRRAQLRCALQQFTPEERPMFIRSLEALATGLQHCSVPDMNVAEWTPSADGATGNAHASDEPPRAASPRETHD